MHSWIIVIIWTLLGYVPTVIMARTGKFELIKNYYWVALVASMIFGPVLGILSTISYITGKTLIEWVE